MDAKAMCRKLHLGFALLLVVLFVVNPIAVCAATQAPAHPCCPAPEPVMGDCEGFFCSGDEDTVSLSEDVAGVAPGNEVGLARRVVDAVGPVVDGRVAQEPRFLLFHQLLV